MGLIRKSPFLGTGGVIAPNSKKQRAQKQLLAALQGKSEDEVRRAGGRYKHSLGAVLGAAARKRDGGAAWRAEHVPGSKEYEAAPGSRRVAMNLVAHPGLALLVVGLGVLAMSGILAACGSGSPVAAPVPSSTTAASAATASSAPPPVTCSTVTSDNGQTASQVIGVLVSDQKSQDAQLSQNWVGLTDGTQTSQGDDLAAAAQVLGSYSGTQLAADGSTFATDAQTFLSDQSGGIMPGWTPEYRQVASDIHALASDCSQGWTAPASVG